MPQKKSEKLLKDVTENEDLKKEDQFCKSKDEEPLKEESKKLSSNLADENKTNCLICKKLSDQKLKEWNKIKSSLPKNWPKYKLDTVHWWFHNRLPTSLIAKRVLDLKGNSNKNQINKSKIRWGKLSGYAWWPCKVINNTNSSTVKVEWYSDKSTSSLTTSKLLPFVKYFHQK